MEIPVLKTTMIVESHWRVLKHQFLHRFNRPRIDLVTWILITRVMPDALVRMRAVKSGEKRVKKTGLEERLSKTLDKASGFFGRAGQHCSIPYKPAQMGLRL